MFNVTGQGKDMASSVLKVAVATIGLGTAFVPGLASAVQVAGGLRVTTLGLGAEATIGVTDYLNVRVPFNVLDYDKTVKEDGIDYDGKLKLNSFGAQLDLHPFKGSFYLTAGLYSDSSKIKALATDRTGTTEYDIGDEVFYSDTADPLRLNGRMDFNSTVPYVGLGWGNAIQGNSPLYFRFELGAYFWGSPKVGLTADGSAVNQQGLSFDVNDTTNPTTGAAALEFQGELEKERANFEDDAKDYKFWPVIGFALGYRFGS